MATPDHPLATQNDSELTPDQIAAMYWQLGLDEQTRERLALIQQAARPQVKKLFWIQTDSITRAYSERD